MFKKYSDFKFSLNENVQQAKTYMKNRALRTKIQMVGPGTEEKRTGISPEEVRQAESGNIDRGYEGPLRKYFTEVNPNYQKIKKMCESQPGWTYMFTKFFFDEEVPEDARPSIEDLQTMFDTMVETRQQLNQLPMNLLTYPSWSSKKTPEFDNDTRSSYEKLGDDLEKIKDSGVVKKFTDELTKSLAAEYEQSGPVIKEKVAGIAKAFAQLGEEGGKIDKDVNRRLQRLFFSAMKDDKNLAELIERALRHIKSTNNAGLSKFLQLIDQCNEKFGSSNGAKIIWNENDILIVEVYSYVANALLNGGTRHCIARSQSHWNSYVGGEYLDDRAFNKQYYIYNFKLSPADNKSVIGITIGQGTRTIYACHLKDDGAFADGIRSYMKQIGVPFEVLAPMSKDEVDAKKRRIEANKKIIKEKISLEEARKCIEDGADPNASVGTPLVNAVKEDNFEKAKYLISVGSSPNVGKAIREARNLPMIKLLVAHGSEITGEVFAKLFTPQEQGKFVKRDPATGKTVVLKGEEVDEAKKATYDAVKYIIDQGIDVNFEQTICLRKAIGFGDLSIVKLLIDNGAKFQNRRYMSIRIACEYSNLEILQYLMGLIPKTKDPDVKSDFDMNTEEGKKKCMKFYTDMAVWASTSDKATPEMASKLIDYVEQEFWSKVSNKPITSADPQIRNF